ncbi:hypothetical protein D7W82_02065 [Corallococcus sp. CA049B]|nr:hypothetical protein D7W82_02065 [Corallococcus sp. CA049B]
MLERFGVLLREAAAVHEEGPCAGFQFVFRCLFPHGFFIRCFGAWRGLDSLRRKQRLHFDVHWRWCGVPRAT